MAEIGLGSFTKSLPSIGVDSTSKVHDGKELGKSGSGGSFIESLKSAIGNVNESMATADKAAQKFAGGEAQNLHDIMIAMEKADLSLRTLTAVRGKIVEAYQEIMKMPV